MKKFELTTITKSHDLVFKYAKIIDNNYTLQFSDLNTMDKHALAQCLLESHANISECLQEYIDLACMDRNYAESQPWGQWDV